MTTLYVIRPKGFNIGNDVIQVAINHFIKMSFDANLNIISLPATNKYEAHKKAGLSGSTVYEINQFGDGVIVGGGNLYENNELLINKQALAALDKPMIIFSVSRGRVYNTKLEFVDRTDVMSDSDMYAVNEKADIALSRDAATQEYIKGLGIDTINGACPTLFINEAPQHEVILHKDQHTDCLISIRTPSLMSIPVAYQYELRPKLLETIAMLKSKGYENIKLLCHDHRDIPFAASFSEVDYLYTEDVYTYLSWLKHTRLNLTFRLHSFIPCLAYDTDTIKISYDQRAKSLVDTIGLDEWNIDYLKQDIVKEIEHRIDNMGDLNQMKTKLRATKWPEIHNQFKTSCEDFARLVNDKKLP